MDSELAAKILRQVRHKFDTGQVKMMYFRAIGSPITREVFLPFLAYEDYCSNPHIAPACNRHINRTWCKGECVGQSCIFWGSEGMGTINLERTSVET